MNLKEAKKITGGLSSPSKMPGYAYNLPAWQCVTGVKLQAVAGSVCSGCYAMKGRYRFPNVKDALNRRLNSLNHPQWVEAIVTLISHYSRKVPFFRWHDSGDLQGVWHLKKIFEVCNNTPGTMHWLPTQERRYLPLGSYPKNLVIRLSNAKNNTAPGQAWTHWSTVVDSGGNCPASKQGNQCKSCRRCWSRDVKHVTYPKH